MTDKETLQDAYNQDELKIGRLNMVIVGQSVENVNLREEIKNLKIENEDLKKQIEELKTQNEKMKNCHNCEFNGLQLNRDCGSKCIDNHKAWKLKK